MGEIDKSPASAGVLHTSVESTERSSSSTVKRYSSVEQDTLYRGRPSEILNGEDNKKSADQMREATWSEATWSEPVHSSASKHTK
jgi:hypothetical protein